MAESVIQSGVQDSAPPEKRVFAVVAYILPLIGGLLGMALDGGNPLTRAHARQSAAAVLTLGLGFAAWAVVGYAVGLIPMAGPIASLSLFSLVIALALFLALNWIVNLLMALRGLERTIPLANKLARRLFGD